VEETLVIWERQDYYDTNVLGLDGRGIAEKYGLQYADGGLATLFSMKR
jgi:hypothetical protein